MGTQGEGKGVTMVTKSAAVVIKRRGVLYLRKRGFLFYILPGGKIEKGETKMQALEREMYEELSARIVVLGKIGIIEEMGFNKSLDALEKIKLHLYRVRLLNQPKISGEITDKTYIRYRNMHRYLLTPVGIRTLEFLNQGGLID